MDNPAVTREELLARLRDVFYSVVPPTYQTYCAFGARVCQQTLQNFGFDATLVPCQLWWASEEQNYVLGFCREDTAPRWNGHVAVVTGTWLMDVAVRHVQKDLDVPVPMVALTETFKFPTNMIARLDLRQGERLWWLQPPAGWDLAIPQEPGDTIARLADALTIRIGTSLNASAAVALGDNMASTQR